MSATVAITLARVLYPLTGVSDAVLTAWYGWATSIAGTDGFGADAPQAHAHLLGHAGEAWAMAGGIAGTPGSGVAGPVTSSRSSTLAISYGSGGAVAPWTPGSAGDAALMQTLGGRAYLALRDTQPEVVIPTVM